MGLRELAEARKNIKPLPSKQTAFFFDVEKCFVSFLEDIKIEKAGFLTKIDSDNFVLSFPVGLNLTSVHRLIIPEKILLKPVNSESAWTQLSSDDFFLFKNFFASQEYLAITEILLFSLKRNEEVILLVKSKKDINRDAFDFEKANTVLKSFIPMYNKYISIFQNAKPVYPFQKGMNTVKLKINSALKENNFATLFEISFKAIFPDELELQTNVKSLRLYYSVVNKIMNAIGKSNIAVLDEGLRICLFSKQAVAVDLYFSQMKKILIPVYGEAFCNALIIRGKRNSENANDILDFLNIERNDKAS